MHGVTGSGALWGLLALAAVARHEWRAASAWMTVALAVDGMLARAARVKEVLPWFDVDARANLAVVAFFALMVFVPLKWVYPSRMKRRAISVAAVPTTTTSRLMTRAS